MHRMRPLYLSTALLAVAALLTAFPGPLPAQQAGLGENVPISTANLNDGFVAFKDGKMIMLRVPYPMGFFAKGLDGRIDDPNAGWKAVGCGARMATARRG